MKCEKCQNDMHKIGPFADAKHEGQPAKKWDGSIGYQCINPECGNYGIIITKKLQQ